MTDQEKTRVVVTFFKPADGGVERMHAFGPFTELKAMDVKADLLQDFDERGLDGDYFTAKVAPLQDYPDDERLFLP
ncbi:hypothetical protein KHQ84_gp144 [Rhodococcus phage Finch]|uniref:Uncharacterized protein n=1 Tax=Rhodococcus phage Finch TaxID=2094144 RepID=A0A2P1JXQ5_9CAUD|nr:hypothetical protein KHQ84_gp144 [Rhodococcus phage Finch]AVO25074.1 hypothetical protein SEA_FINCH_144 [Rhodococcus phage Finch]